MKLLAAALAAALVPLGADFEVAAPDAELPSVGFDAAGTALVTFGAPGGDVGLRAYGSDGAPLGPGQLLWDASGGLGGSGFAAIALHPDGDLRVAWGAGTSGMRFTGVDGTGNPDASSARIDQGSTVNPDEAALAIAADGTTLVAWSGAAFQDPTGGNIRARFLDASGAFLTPDFRVNDTTEGNQSAPDVAVAPDGAIFVLWADTEIRGRSYDAGTGASPEFQINAYTTGIQRRPAIAMARDGSSLVVWDGDGSPGNDDDFSSVQATGFSTSGEPLAEFQVNSYTTYDQGGLLLGGARLTALDDGSFLVVWPSQGSPDVSAGQDFLGSSIQARRVTGAGPGGASETQVNTTIAGDQVAPSVARAPGGRVLVVWQDDPADIVRGRFLAVPGTTALFDDDFESGDTDGWDLSTPVR